MKFGFCANLPERCEKAARKEKIMMIGPEPRCPRCGVGLIEVPRTFDRRRLALLVIGWLALAAVLGALIVGRPHSASEKPAAAAPAPEYLLRLSGSNTIGAVLVPRLVDAWLVSLGATGVTLEQRRDAAGALIPEMVVKGKLGERSVAVEVRAHGSANAFIHLLDGSADIGMASRPVNTSEKEKLLKVMGDMTSRNSEHIIGLDGIAVIVAPGNPIDRIAIGELARIFRGEVTDWSQIGAGNGPIRVYARDAQSGTYDTFKALVIKEGALVADARRYEDTEQLESAVAQDAGAIGFVGLPYVKAAKSLLVSDGVNTLALAPTVITVKKEDYALSRRLYLYTASNPGKPVIRDFVNFIQTNRGQDVVKAVGFVDQIIDDFNQPKRTRASASARPCQLSAEWPGSRNAYCDSVASKSDIGTTFRFIIGSDKLDNRANEDVQRLLRVLAEHPAGRLTLIGFSDNTGSYARNLELSNARAIAVKTALRSVGIEAVDAIAFGQELPVADNGTNSGRERNRRVEVWVN